MENTKIKKMVKCNKISIFKCHILFTYSICVSGSMRTFICIRARTEVGAAISYSII